MVRRCDDIWTGKRWAYLAAVMDLFARKPVGWAMSHSPVSNLTCQALTLSVPNIPQHTIQRGNNRLVSFFSGQNHAVYLNKLKNYASKYAVSVHAFVLMTNHVHLLMTPSTKKGVSQLMQTLGRCYVMYANKTDQRTGTLWEGRYKSTLVDSEYYFLTVSRYTDLNPIQANIVKHRQSSLGLATSAMA